jgi:ATP phosphoribosyltransferase regulatory subunit
LCITLNNVEIFNGIAENLQLDHNSRERLRELIDVRDASGLSELLDSLGVNAADRDLFVRVTRLAGKRSILNEAKKVITNSRSLAALNRLRQTWETIEALGLADSFEIDLGDVSALDYYTGLLFKVYVRGAGNRVGRGGRYDQLTSAFGRPEPAIGFVLDLDALTEVIARADSSISRRDSNRSVEIDARDLITGLRNGLQRRARDERVRLVV